MNPQQAELRLSYEFDAPKELVFNAFADADALNEWWGPVESRNSVMSLDFRPGGIFHFKMDFNGHVSYGRFLFRKIQPYDLLEFTNGFADEKANVVKAPFDIELPLEMLYRCAFAEQNGKTTISLHVQPLDASEGETAGFIAINESMHEGFGATFGKLTGYLQKKTRS
ncbi:SRPBCC family protein [Chitinophaga sp. 22620]|uniref:SRPBCC family protein n=1 Tax=Chitinophaga sp. 22620 TaxID=3453952 RepID=UPI003F85F543